MTDEPAEPALKEKKSKKAKKANVQEPEPAAPEEEETSKQDEEQESAEEDSKKSKKAEKKRKRASDAAEAEESSMKKDKKEKKSKGKKSTAESDAAAAEGEQWHVEDLDGGSARQQKFLRLLGGKKAGAAGGVTTSHAPKGKSDSTKAEADIQRQFEAGMKAKAEGGSKRRGLGA